MSRFIGYRVHAGSKQSIRTFACVSCRTTLSGSTAISATAHDEPAEPGRQILFETPLQQQTELHRNCTGTLSLVPGKAARYLLNIIVPSAFHAPPSGVTASANTCSTPPPMSILFSLSDVRLRRRSPPICSRGLQARDQSIPGIKASLPSYQH